jgi:hypothetical protein
MPTHMREPGIDCLGAPEGRSSRHPLRGTVAAGGLACAQVSKEEASMATPNIEQPPETPELDRELLERSKSDPGASFTKKAHEVSQNTRMGETPQSVPGGPYGPGERDTQLERK